MTKPVSAEALALFNRQLAAMLGLELPLPESLRRASADLGDPRLAAAAAELAREVEGGGALSEGVARRTGELPEIYAALIRAGEAAGNLAEALRWGADYSEKMASLSNRIRSAMIYPAILLGGFVALLLLLGMWVVPRMRFLLEFGISGFRMELPLPTRFIFGLWGVVGHWAAWAALAAAGAALYSQRRKAWAWIEEFQFRVPLWKDFMLCALLSRFCRTLLALLKSGVAVQEAFNLTKRTMGNRVFEEALAKSGEAVAAGGRIADSLGRTGVFPATFTWILGAAEARGDLLACLGELADYYEHACERRALLLERAIEPAVMAALGLIVGATVVAFFLPMLSLGTFVE